MNLIELKGIALVYGQKIILAIVLLLIGFKVASYLVNKLDKVFEKRNLDVSLRPFLCSVIGWILKAAVFLAAANTAGFKTTSFIALLGAAGLAIGMALQGSLSNFAGGVIILLLKPFKVGDFIQAQGFAGTVKEITTFMTVIKTGDNQIIYIPNGKLANAPIQNVNQEPIRRVDFTFGIGYEDSIDEAKALLRSLFEADDRVFKDPAVSVNVASLADSSVNIAVKVWANKEDYWPIFFEYTEKVKKEFDAKGISIPFPQTEMTIKPSSEKFTPAQ